VGKKLKSRDQTKDRIVHEKGSTCSESLEEDVKSTSLATDRYRKEETFDYSGGAGVNVEGRCVG